MNLNQAIGKRIRTIKAYNKPDFKNWNKCYGIINCSGVVIYFNDSTSLTIFSHDESARVENFYDWGYFMALPGVRSISFDKDTKYTSYLQRRRKYYFTLEIVVNSPFCINWGSDNESKFESVWGK